MSAISVAVSLALAPAMALAEQEKGEDDPASNEVEKTSTTMDSIMVTAQFREQNLQDTPIAISAVNSEMMEARGLTSVLDIAASAPNVNIKPTVGNYGSGAAISIRGVGQYDSNFALEPGVGIYIDDVYHPTVFGSVFDLLDLDRVEILRGPQGTLAGKNSIGGAVKLYSKRPDENTGGFVEATYGDANRIDFRGGANFTLIPETLFMRVSGVVKKRDGYMTRYDYGCRNPDSGVPNHAMLSNCKLGTEGGQDFQGIRAALRWLPNENWEVNLIADTSDDNSEPPATRLLRGPNPIYVTNEQYVNYSTYAGTGWLSSPKSTMSGKGVSAKVDYRINDVLGLTSISSYRDYSGAWGVDADGSPLPYYTQYWDVDYRAKSQEFRLNGTAFGDALDYTVGGYYFDGSGRYAGLVEIPRLYALHDDPVSSESLSGFAHGIYKFNDTFDMSAGIRYTDESKDYKFSRIDPLTGLPQSAIDGQESHYGGNRWDYRLSGSYHVDERTMLYATYSTGFKGGGVNPRPFSPSQVQPFSPETLQAYELGIKTDLLDKRLRVNGAVFFNRYNDILITITNGYGGFPVSAIPVNAGEADVKGAEVEFTAYPIDGLSIDGSLSYLDFKYTKLSTAALASRMNYDMVAPYVSRYKASIGTQYDIWFQKGRLTPRLDANFQSSFFTNAINTQLGEVKTSMIYNARMTWRPNDANWETAFGVANLFNKYYYLNKIDVTSASNIATATPARPREWFVTMKYNF
jgi:iron complex outermembrane receptor protein